MSGLKVVIGVFVVVFLMQACENAANPPSPDGDSFEVLREQMVNTQLVRRGIGDERVLKAMRTVERHYFVPESIREFAYVDQPLPIGHDQTISQPYIVALMTELLQPDPEDRVLEIGTGSGYQAAVLAELVGHVYTIEIVEPLGTQATTLLNDTLGYDNVSVRIGDGYAGWPEHAPFDKVMLTAAPPRIPQPLIDQLAVGGRLVAPVGTGNQELVLLTRTETDLITERILPVRFVPMTGQAQQPQSMN